MDTIIHSPIDEFYSIAAERFSPRNVRVSLSQGSTLTPVYNVVIYREGAAPDKHAVGNGTTIDNACKAAGVHLVFLNETDLDNAKQLCIAAGLLPEDA